MRKLALTFPIIAGTCWGCCGVFVILFGRILFGEKITKVKIICMLVALTGCVLLSGVVESGGLKWSILEEEQRRYQSSPCL